MVRYADDAVLMFEHEEDAVALRAVLETSLARYGLEMNVAKTRLLGFGRTPPGGGKSGVSTFSGSRTSPARIARAAIWCDVKRWRSASAQPDARP
ncbi:MAG: reverse transcriptase domain-containing protein [Lysobacterales bacterium]